MQRGGSIESKPVVYGNVVYIGCNDHIFYAINAVTGNEVWKFETNGIIISAALLHNNTIYFGSHDRNLYALNLNGELVWKFTAEDMIVCEPAFIDEFTRRYRYDPVPYLPLLLGYQYKDSVVAERFRGDYSRLVSDLWRDRERSDSEALARWMTRRGS